MNIQPLKDKVLVAENNRQTTTESGIILDSQGVGESKSGTVLAIGPDVTDVQVGDVIYLMWNKAQIVKVGDAQRVIIKQEDKIVGVTTAAFIWCISAVGVLAGLGAVWTPILLTLGLLIVSLVVEQFETIIKKLTTKKKNGESGN